MFVVWLTGISGSGKTTIGKALYKEIKDMDRKVDFLDGDDVRKFFEGDLGYSREDRIRNNKRFIFAAMLLERNGVIAVVANIAPYKEIREWARKKLNKYIQIYVKASPDECRRRDVKGHYKKLTSGQIDSFVGEDQEYDVPEDPDLIVDTEHETPAQSVSRILNYLKERKCL